MSNLPHIIAEDELLARFVVYRRWVREDTTLRADAFIPHPYPDLSVTRHWGLSEFDLWQAGASVAAQRSNALIGRADFKAGTVTMLSLSINPAPESANPNHANITGWPQEKSAQKSLAQQLAAQASFVSNPDVSRAIG